eukprot:Awhi_evm1s536
MDVPGQQPSYGEETQSITNGYIGTVQCADFRAFGDEICKTLAVPERYAQAGKQWKYNSRGRRALDCITYNGSRVQAPLCIPDSQWHDRNQCDDRCKHKYGREGLALNAEIFCSLL